MAWQRVEGLRELERKLKMAWSKDKVIEVYDRNPNLTLKVMSSASGYTVSELIEILVDNDQEKLRKRSKSSEV